MKRLLHFSSAFAIAAALTVAPAFAEETKTAEKKNEEKAKPAKKKPAKKDVEAIGERDVGKGTNFYSIEKEIALGKGLAQELMARVVRTAKEVGARTVWLGVWERNPRGIAFYRKCGYVDVGSKVYVVGSDPQTDRVMTRPVEL